MEPKNKAEAGVGAAAEGFLPGRAPVDPLQTADQRGCGRATGRGPDKAGRDPEDPAERERCGPSFHNYGRTGKMFEKAHTVAGRRGRRPILCTEYMARPNGSTFSGEFYRWPKKYNVAAIKLGIREREKSQTNLPWDSLERSRIRDREPVVWFPRHFFHKRRAHHIPPRRKWIFIPADYGLRSVKGKKKAKAGGGEGSMTRPGAPGPPGALEGQILRG